MKTMTTDDLRETLYEAQDHLNKAIRRIETYVNEPGDRNAEAYLLDHLRIFASSEHGYLTRDINIDDLIARLDEHYDEDEDEAEIVDEPALHIRTPSGLDLYYSPGLGRYVTIPEDDEE